MSAASVWDTIGDPLGERLADDLRQMVRDYDAVDERNLQTALGPSAVGSACVRCLARAALDQPVVDPYDDPWCRIIGTATHEWLNMAAAAANVISLNLGRAARWTPEQRVHPDDDLLEKGGSADLYDHDTYTVIDHKVVGAEPLRKYRLNGPGPQYRTQGHVYGLGYENAGHEVRHVAVAFWNRGGKLRDLYVWTEPYNRQLALDALERWRTIRDQALNIGPALIPLLPADPSCWDCRGKDVEQPTGVAS